MTEFIELEEYSPETQLKTKILINIKHISFLKQSGIYTTLGLFFGKELKITERVPKILELCRQKTADK